MNALLFVALGCLTGAHAATWGAHKDTPFEGFKASSFVRSIVLGAVAGLLLGPALSGTHVLVALGVLYTTERLATEWWKTIVREDDQSAYTIPMRLGVGGRPVDAPVRRWTVGLLVAGGFAVACAAASMVSVDGWSWWLAALAGGSSGWFIAAGGAWKDAPIEGFSGWKFLRSPVVATGCAVVVAVLTRDLVWLMLASGGYSVAAIETYKTFVNRGAPGKFADKPRPYAGQVRARRVSALLHSMLWVAFAVTALTLVPQMSTGADVVLIAAAGLAAIGAAKAVQGAGPGVPDGVHSLMSTFRKAPPWFSPRSGVENATSRRSRPESMPPPRSCSPNADSMP